jgi:hypothetical protein
MIGAMAVVGFLAILASVMATLSNLTIAREFPKYQARQDADLNFEDYVLDQAIRLARYRQAASMFYYEALILWSALAILLGANFLLDLVR